MYDQGTVAEKESAKADLREQFAQKLLGTLNSAGLAMMLSIGHRTGLLDRMSEVEWAGSEQIAERAGLKERYVREWLGAMVTSGVVEYDPKRKTYRLPPVHASLLTRAATPENFAVAMQWIAVLGRVEDEIVEAFQKGGGVLGTCWGVELADKMLREAGFTQIAVHRLPHDVFNCFFVIRK